MLNKIQLIGHTGSDPEVFTFDNGNKQTKISLATTEYWKDKNSGEKKSDTEWHNLVFNGKLAEIAEKYIKKGDKIYVEGKKKTKSFENNSGEKKYIVNININDLKMLGNKIESSSENNSLETTNPNYQDQDNLPF